MLPPRCVFCAANDLATNREKAVSVVAAEVEVQNLGSYSQRSAVICSEKSILTFEETNFVVLFFLKMNFKLLLTDLIALLKKKYSNSTITSRRCNHSWCPPP